MPRANQRVVTLPKTIVDKVEALVADDPDYSSIADFVKEAIRLRLETVCRRVVA